MRVQRMLEAAVLAVLVTLSVAELALANVHTVFTTECGAQIAARMCAYV